MRIEYSDKAKKFFKKAPKSDQVKVIKKITLLSKEPYVGKKLRGEFQDTRSLRTWPYRIIYLIRENSVYIVTIKHRQGAYK